MSEPRSSAGNTAQDRVRKIVEEVIAGTPLFVVDVTVRGQKGSRVVDVYIESDEVLDAAALASVSREVGFLLEVEEVIDGRYHLNVSSPGADRPMTSPRQYRKHVGRPLQVTIRTEAGEATLDGTLTEADDAALELAVDKNEVRRIPVADVVRAKVKLPW